MYYRAGNRVLECFVVVPTADEPVGETDCGVLHLSNVVPILFNNHIYMYDESLLSQRGSSDRSAMGTQFVSVFRYEDINELRCKPISSHDTCITESVARSSI